MKGSEQKRSIWGLADTRTMAPEERGSWFLYFPFAMLVAFIPIWFGSYFFVRPFEHGLIVVGLYGGICSWSAVLVAMSIGKLPFYWWRGRKDHN